MSVPSSEFRAAFDAGAAWNAAGTSRPDYEQAVQQAWEGRGWRPMIVQTRDDFDRIGEGDPLIPCEEDGTPRIHGEVITRANYLGEWAVAEDDAPFLVLAPTAGGDA